MHAPLLEFSHLPLLFNKHSVGRSGRPRFWLQGNSWQASESSGNGQHKLHPAARRLINKVLSSSMLLSFKFNKEVGTRQLRLAYIYIYMYIYVYIYIYIHEFSVHYKTHNIASDLQLGQHHPYDCKPCICPVTMFTIKSLEASAA
jgi:hypothetical protein